MNPDSQNLDLSNYPKIVPPTEEESEEIEKRSKAIQAIKVLADNLIKAMQSYIFDLQTFDSKIRMLNQREAQIKTAELTNADKEQAVYAREAEIKSKEEYLVNLGIELKEKELKLGEDKKILEEIEKAKGEYEEIKEQAIKVQMQLGTMNKLMADIKEREHVVEKREEVDAERKKLLDVRENRIKDQEIRHGLEQKE
jgi:hypothetical protein